MASLNPRATALLLGMLLAQQQNEETAASDDDQSENGHPPPPPMPVPIVVPHPTQTPDEGCSVAAALLPHDTAVPLFVNVAMPMPENCVLPMPQQGVPPVPQNCVPPIPQGGLSSRPQVPNGDPKVPSRPPSPTDTDVATTSIAWQLFTLPLYARIAETLYHGDKTLPPQTSGSIGFLKLDGYGARDTTDNMCCLVEFLHDHSWDDQVVSTFIDTMRGKPHWPKKLANAPPEAHTKYVWSMIEGILGFFAYKDYLPPTPPTTFHGIVTRMFPEQPETATSRFLRLTKRVAKPQCFSFSVRDLLGEDFIIEPSNNIADHLKMHGNAIKVFILDSPSVKFMMSYHKNRAAQAIGMSNLGNEIIQSYAVLTQSEFQENFKLPIQLGMFKIDPDNAKRSGYDDLTIITGIIRLFQNNPDFDPQPHLLANRVYTIETALRARRHWYMRLRRDIHKRKKEEPWMFWGAVLAVFFGICTVIQTVTSVLSLVRS